MGLRLLLLKLFVVFLDNDFLLLFLGFFLSLSFLFFCLGLVGFCVHLELIFFVQKFCVKVDRFFILVFKLDVVKATCLVIIILFEIKASEIRFLKVVSWWVFQVEFFSFFRL